MDLLNLKIYTDGADRFIPDVMEYIQEYIV